MAPFFFLLGLFLLGGLFGPVQYHGGASPPPQNEGSHAGER